eukprot:PhM_4_TR2649/c0_g1_i1/m.38578
MDPRSTTLLLAPPPVVLIAMALVNCMSCFRPGTFAGTGAGALLLSASLGGGTTTSISVAVPITVGTLHAPKGTPPIVNKLFLESTLTSPSTFGKKTSASVSSSQPSVMRMLNRAPPELASSESLSLKLNIMPEGNTARGGVLGSSCTRGGCASQNKGARTCTVKSRVPSSGFLPSPTVMRMARGGTAGSPGAGVAVVVKAIEFIMCVSNPMRMWGCSLAGKSMRRSRTSTLVPDGQCVRGRVRVPMGTPSLWNTTLCDSTRGMRMRGDPAGTTKSPSSSSPSDSIALMLSSSMMKLASFRVNRYAAARIMAPPTPPPLLRRERSNSLPNIFVGVFRFSAWGVLAAEMMPFGLRPSLAGERGVRDDRGPVIDVMDDRREPSFVIEGRLPAAPSDDDRLRFPTAFFFKLKLFSTSSSCCEVDRR